MTFQLNVNHETKAKMDLKYAQAAITTIVATKPLDEHYELMDDTTGEVVFVFSQGQVEMSCDFLQLLLFGEPNSYETKERNFAKGD